MCEDLATILHERGETAARTVSVPTAATLPPGTPLPKLRRRRRPVSPVVWAVSGGAALVILAVALSAGGDSIATNSQAAVTGSPGGTIATQIPRATAIAPRSLTVKVTDGASIKIGTDSVGVGSWTSDTLPPGTYVVSSAITGSMPRCPTATRQQQVTLDEVGVDTITLQPRDCGWVTIIPRFNRRIRDATWTLQNVEWRTSGKLAQNDSIRLLVPIGANQLKVRASYCADFTASIVVTRGTEKKQYVRPICDAE
jgi:hypothetical protein